MSYSKAKWSLYILLFTIGIWYSCEQFFIERFMQLYVARSKFIVTLTTTPHRIDKIQDTLTSILKQSITPDKIYLAIPYVFKRDNTPYVIPAWLQNEERITIIRTNDYGPATKLLGILAQEKIDPDTIIITMDDDINYPANTLLHLVYKSVTNPKYAVGVAGLNIQYNIDGLVSNDVPGGVITFDDNNKFVSILEGFAGVAYRRHFFDDTIFDIMNAPQACINSDDLYISFHLAKKNIPRQIFKNKFIDKYKIDHQTEISHDNNALHNMTPTPAEKHRACVTFMHQVEPLVIF